MERQRKSITNNLLPRERVTCALRSSHRYIYLEIYLYLIHITPSFDVSISILDWFALYEILKINFCFLFLIPVHKIHSTLVLTLPFYQHSNHLWKLLAITLI